METLKPADVKRPNLEDFNDPVSFVEAMLTYRKKSERGFSILKATASLRRVSPALVSLVVSRKRALTADRADEFAKLLALTAAERHFFKSWISGETLDRRLQNGATSAAPLNASSGTPSNTSGERARGERKNRKDVSTHILKDWLNIYVKDLFMFEDVQKNPALAEKMLLHVASPKRVQGAIEFLKREGHLRTTLDGRTVLDTPLSVTDPKVPSQKIRAFHKAALTLAIKAIDRVESTERLANTLILPLNETSYRELLDLIEEFGEKLKDFASAHPDDGTTLYQLIVNASPVGGKLK